MATQQIEEYNILGSNLTNLLSQYKSQKQQAETNKITTDVLGFGELQKLGDAFQKGKTSLEKIPSGFEKLGKEVEKLPERLQNIATDVKSKIEGGVSTIKEGIKSDVSEITKSGLDVIQKIKSNTMEEFKGAVNKLSPENLKSITELQKTYLDVRQRFEEAKRSGSSPEILTNLRTEGRNIAEKVSNISGMDQDQLASAMTHKFFNLPENPLNEMVKTTKSVAGDALGLAKKEGGKLYESGLYKSSKSANMFSRNFDTDPEILHTDLNAFHNMRVSGINELKTASNDVQNLVKSKFENVASNIEKTASGVASESITAVKAGLEKAGTDVLGAVGGILEGVSGVGEAVGLIASAFGAKAPSMPQISLPTVQVL
jgi:hypothetical protein